MLFFCGRGREGAESVFANFFHFLPLNIAWHTVLLLFRFGRISLLATDAVLASYRVYQQWYFASGYFLSFKLFCSSFYGSVYAVPRGLSWISLILHLSQTGFLQSIKNSFFFLFSFCSFCERGKGLRVYSLICLIFTAKHCVTYGS